MTLHSRMIASHLNVSWLSSTMRTPMLMMGVSRSNSQTMR